MNSYNGGQNPSQQDSKINVLFPGVNQNILIGNNRPNQQATQLKQPQQNYQQVPQYQYIDNNMQMNQQPAVNLQQYQQQPYQNSQPPVNQLPQQPYNQTIPLPLQVDSKQIAGANIQVKQQLQTNYPAPNQQQVQELLPTLPDQVEQNPNFQHYNPLYEKLLGRLNIIMYIQNIQNCDNYCLIFFDTKHLDILKQVPELMQKYHRVCFICICVDRIAMNTHLKINLATEGTDYAAKQYLENEDCKKVEQMIFIVQTDGQAVYQTTSINQTLLDKLQQI